MEERIGRIASRQHGVITRAELLAVGVSNAGIQRRVRKGTLIPEYRGVYRVGHRAGNMEAKYLAAVRACGDGAFLSGRAAGHLHGILKGPPPPPEVTAPVARRIPGVVTRRSRSIDPCEITKVRGIPVTNVPRTLVDLAAVLAEDELARACHEAGVRYRTTPRQVEAVLARWPNAPGAGKLRKVLRGEVQVTLSKLERAFLSLLGGARLPLPETNRVAGGRRVDCRWADQRVTVELDGYRYHNSRYAWEQDRRREREARVRGDRFRRYTWSDVFEDPSFMLEDLRNLLRSRV